MNDPRQIPPGAPRIAPAAPVQPRPVSHPPPVPPRAVAPPGAPPKITAIPVQAMPKDDLSSIALVDGFPEEEKTQHKIQAFGVREVIGDHKYKRKATLSGNGAVHVKTFHGRLSEEGLGYVDDKINDWLEKNPEVEVKFATSAIGLFDGKVKDLALIVNIWY